MNDNVQDSASPEAPEAPEALMEKAQRGDGAAYARLLHEITPLLRRVIRRQRAFLNLEDVEDLVQEVLLSVHAVRFSYDPGRPFMPWLFAIARNRLADGARRYSRQGAHEIAIDETAVTYSAASANTIQEEYGDQQELHRAIGELPPTQRDAIEMLKLREMSLKEASKTSGITTGALKVATHRAMTSLRKLMKRRP
jgi:RNA polymerase sigma-70 factor (ECF subfamily)